MPMREKIANGYFGIPSSYYSEATKKKLSKSIKYVDLWLFIGLSLGINRDLIASPLYHPILKRAFGEFLPLSDNDKR